MIFFLAGFLPLCKARGRIPAILHWKRHLWRQAYSLCRLCPLTRQSLWSCSVFRWTLFKVGCACACLILFLKRLWKKGFGDQRPQTSPDKAALLHSRDNSSPADRVCVLHGPRGSHFFHRRTSCSARSWAGLSFSEGFAERLRKQRKVSLGQVEVFVGEHLKFR